MFCYEVLGFVYIEKKNMFILHLCYDRAGVKGKAVETIFVRQQSIEGNKIDVGSIIRVYRDNQGYVLGVEVI